MTPDPLEGLLEASEIAQRLGLTLHTLQRYLADPDHPKFIPNVKLGRKRFIKREDFERWFETQKGLR